MTTSDLADAKNHIQELEQVSAQDKVILRQTLSLLEVARKSHS
jgi:hypothetical protein